MASRQLFSASAHPIAMKLLGPPSLVFALTFSAFQDVAFALTRDQVPSPPNARFLTIPAGDSTTAVSTIQNATFEQLIDHENPSLGTFSQFYYYSTEFYKGPGSPVVSGPQILSQNKWLCQDVCEFSTLICLPCRYSSHPERLRSLTLVLTCKRHPWTVG